MDSKIQFKCQKELILQDNRIKSVLKVLKLRKKHKNNDGIFIYGDWFFFSETDQNIIDPNMLHSEILKNKVLDFFSKNRNSKEHTFEIKTLDVIDEYTNENGDFYFNKNILNNYPDMENNNNPIVNRCNSISVNKSNSISINSLVFDPEVNNPVFFLEQFQKCKEIEKLISTNILINENKNVLQLELLKFVDILKFKEIYNKLSDKNLSYEEMNLIFVQNFSKIYSQSKFEKLNQSFDTTKFSTLRSYFEYMYNNFKKFLILSDEQQTELILLKMENSTFYQLFLEKRMINQNKETVLNFCDLITNQVIKNIRDRNNDEMDVDDDDEEAEVDDDDEVDNTVSKFEKLETLKRVIAEEEAKQKKYANKKRKKMINTSENIDDNDDYSSNSD